MLKIPRSTFENKDPYKAQEKIGQTLSSLLEGGPELEIVFKHQKGESGPFKATLKEKTPDQEFSELKLDLHSQEENTQSCDSHDNGNQTPKSGVSEKSLTSKSAVDRILHSSIFSRE